MMKVILSLFILLLFVPACNNNSQIKDKKIEEEINKRAIEKYTKKEYSSALLDYDTLIKIDSSNAGYYFRRGYCKFMLLNNDEGAIFDFLKSIELDYVRKESAYLNIGAIYRAQVIFRSNSDKESLEKYKKALYYYEECLKINPNNLKAMEAKKEIIENLVFFEK